MYKWCRGTNRFVKGCGNRNRPWNKKCQILFPLYFTLSRLYPPLTNNCAFYWHYNLILYKSHLQKIIDIYKTCNQNKIIYVILLTITLIFLCSNCFLLLHWNLKISTWKFLSISSLLVKLFFFRYSGWAVYFDLF